jgi:hypothetical protein
MERQCDIFEVLSTGNPIWRCAVSGHLPAIEKLRELSVTTKNELQLMHIPTTAVIAIVNQHELKAKHATGHGAE